MDLTQVVVTLLVAAVIVLALWVTMLHVRPRGETGAPAAPPDIWTRREVLAWEQVAVNLGRIADAMSGYAPSTLEYAPEQPTLDTREARNGP